MAPNRDVRFLEGPPNPSEEPRNPCLPGLPVAEEEQPTWNHDTETTHRQLARQPAMDNFMIQGIGVTTEQWLAEAIEAGVHDEAIDRAI